MILGYISQLFFALCLIPQPIKTVIMKDVRGVSPMMWWLQIGGYFFGLGYGLRISQWPLILGSLFGLIVSIIFLYFYYKYRRN